MISYKKSEAGLRVFRNGVFCGEIRREIRRRFWAGKGEMTPDKWYSWTRANGGLKDAEFSHLRHAKDYVEQNG